MSVKIWRYVTVYFIVQYWLESVQFDVYQTILNRTRDTNERDKRMQVTVKDFCDAIDWF